MPLRVNFPTFFMALLRGEPVCDHVPVVDKDP